MQIVHRNEGYFYTILQQLGGGKDLYLINIKRDDWPETKQYTPAER